MKDEDKTKEQLMDELINLRQQTADLQKSGAECKRAGVAGRAALQYAESIIETVREPLLVLDADLKVLSANRSFFDIFKANPEETIGNHIYDLGNRQWDIPRLRLLLEGILPEKTQFNNFEVEHDFSTVGHKIMLLNARQVYQEEIGRKMILLAVEDITKSKQQERERKNMLSMFAHDMKNPLVTSEGFLLRLISGKAGTIAEKQHKYLQIILSELGKLSQLLSDFLEFSRLEAKGYKPVLAPFNIEAEIRRNIEAGKLEAEKKQVSVSIISPEKMIPMINGDIAMINRVIRNLLDNAVKYTGPGGTATVKVSDRGNEILVSVTDTGTGISSDHTPYIFDAFYRGSRNVGGSGLGLAIARTIIERHGGRIWAESIPGKGSTFSFTLPKQ
ncbi:MAG: PAS domain-containing sensor histidine kinase [Pseudomonadota bacterium]